MGWGSQVAWALLTLALVLVVGLVSRRILREHRWRQQTFREAEHTPTLDLTDALARLEQTEEVAPPEPAVSVQVYGSRPRT